MRLNIAGQEKKKRIIKRVPDFECVIGNAFSENRPVSEPDSDLAVCNGPTKSSRRLNTPFSANSFASGFSVE